MQNHQLSPVEACVFDAYGTLFDVNAPVSRLAHRVGDNADALAALWRRKQLEYTWLLTLMGEHHDFWAVTGHALDYALEALGVDDTGLRAELLALYASLSAYPDARGCLDQLSRRGMKTAILSNGSPTMLAGAVRSAELTDLVTAVLSVEEVGVFKPDRRVYQLAVDRLAVSGAAAVCFVSANPWDAQAGAHFGFQSVRVDRLGLPDERLPGAPVATVTSLAELPALLP